MRHRPRGVIVAAAALVVLVACEPVGTQNTEQTASSTAPTDASIGSTEDGYDVAGLDAVGEGWWLLVEARIDGEPIELTEQHFFSLHSSAEAQLAGSWSCNSWFADLAPSAGDATALEVFEVGQTAMSCGATLDAIEAAWSAALAGVTEAFGAEEWLELRGDGVDLLFRPGGELERG
jgi:heat shock protein HslJ